MGAGTVNAVVADAGSIIHLSEICCLSLLRIFETLHIPNSVWLESVGQYRVLQEDILALGIVQQHNLPQSEVIRFAQENDLEKLQDGERECLYLCKQIGVPILLTDDMAVREKANSLSLTPIGSLGVVVRAYRLGFISLNNAEDCITKLYSVSSLYVTHTIVELAIEQLHKHSNWS